MKIKIYKPQAIYQIGQRDNQEDNMYPEIRKANSDCRVFILCDGMGGHEDGEVASRLVCQYMAEYLNANLKDNQVLTDEMFNQSLDNAFRQLDANDSNSPKKMGTTMTFLCLHKGGCMLAHIGDSRIYHIRPSENRILYKSCDHSLAFELYQAGEIKYEDMASSDKKNAITRAMQPGLAGRVKADIVHVADVLADDWFYLCSDGMLEKMDDDEIVSILSVNASDEQKKKQFENRTATNQDNHSAWLIHVSSVLREYGDNMLPNDEPTVKSNAINIGGGNGKISASGKSKANDSKKEKKEKKRKQKAVDNEYGTTENRDFGKYKNLLLALVALLLVGLLAIWFLSNVDFGKGKSKSDEVELQKDEIKILEKVEPRDDTQQPAQNPETNVMPSDIATQQTENAAATESEQKTEKASQKVQNVPIKEIVIEEPVKTEEIEPVKQPETQPETQPEAPVNTPDNPEPQQPAEQPAGE